MDFDNSVIVAVLVDVSELWVVNAADTVIYGPSFAVNNTYSSFFD